jgi:hypothetical protein
VRWELIHEPFLRKGGLGVSGLEDGIPWMFQMAERSGKAMEGLESLGLDLSGACSFAEEVKVEEEEEEEAEEEVVVGVKGVEKEVRSSTEEGEID